MNPLAQLKDVHAPPPIPWWPPAIGWWILLAVIIAVAIFAFIKYKNRVIIVSYKQKNALMDLDSIRSDYSKNKNVHATLDSISQILKRLAMFKYPERGVAALHDDAWLRFLDETGETDQFTKGAGAALTELRYKPKTNNT